MIISPSKMNLMIFKQKRGAAQHGHKLLEEKRDILKGEFLIVKKRLAIAKRSMGDDTKKAFLSLAEAQIAAGSITQKVLNTIKARPTTKIHITVKNKASVRLPILKYVSANSCKFPFPSQY